MDLLDLVARALTASITSLDDVEEGVENLKRAVCDPDNDPTTLQNKLRHPSMSSTPLPKAEDLALKAYSDVLAKNQEIIRAGLVGVLAIWSAKQRLENIQAAKFKLDEQRTEERSDGLYRETKEYWDDLARNYGATKRELDQQTKETKKTIADLLKWKAMDPRYREEGNPWRLLREIYAGRDFRDLNGKQLSRSQPASSKPTTEVSDLKPQSDQHFRKWITPWAIAPSDGVEYERAEGVGRLDTDDPFGGFLAEVDLPSDITPMWARKTPEDASSVNLGAHSWMKFEAPRGPWAVVHRAEEVPDRYRQQPSAAYPPFPELRTYAVNDGAARSTIKAFEHLGEGEEINPYTLGRPILKVMKERLGFEDAPLACFWIFLLVGRKLGSRVDRYFEEQFFKGAWMPDPASAHTGKGVFRLVRVPHSHRLDLLGVSPFLPRTTPEGPE